MIPQPSAVSVGLCCLETPALAIPESQRPPTDAALNTVVPAVTEMSACGEVARLDSPGGGRGLAFPDSLAPTGAGFAWGKRLTR